MVEHGDHRLGKDEQRHRTRNAQQDDQAQAPIEQGRIALDLALGLGGRQLRRQHRAERDAEQGDRKLHQSIGISQPRGGTCAYKQGDLKIDQQRQLGHANTEQRWRHLAQHLLHARMLPGLS